MDWVVVVGGPWPYVLMLQFTRYRAVKASARHIELPGKTHVIGDTKQPMLAFKGVLAWWISEVRNSCVTTPAGGLRVIKGCLQRQQEIVQREIKSCLTTSM